jgi:uncharacterized protein YdeI (YjbR/CyaY-like superfamily)
MPGKRGSESNPIFFKTAAEYRVWLERNHERATELWIGYWKKSTGKPSLTWPDTVDESLCFGWIDGIRKSIDADSFKQRVTPRRPTSIWSRINIGRVEVLAAEGRMRPAGLAAFERRKKSGVYSFEQVRDRGLDPATKREFRKNKKAWEWFHTQPPGYRKLASFWIMSAKRPETRARRLATLIRDSEAGRRIGPLQAGTKGGGAR